MPYNEDRQWADGYLPQIKEILLFNADKVVDFAIAPKEKDITNATDLIIQTTGGDVAVRLRRSSYKFRDLTIRSLRDSGTETELSKIRKGFGKWYLYGWLDENDRISEWMLVDLDKLRATDLLNATEDEFISNGDGTYFLAIPYNELIENQCIVSDTVNES